MYIINSSSLDVPYEDTNYSCEIVVMSKPPGKQASTIHCSKVMTKKYKDMTYFKVEIPAGVSINSEEEVQINIQRDDSHRLIIQTKIRNNIVAIETVYIKWIAWITQSSQNEWLEQIRRLVPYTNQNINMNPVWDTRDSINLGSASPSTMMFRASTNTVIPDGASANSFIGYANSDPVDMSISFSTSAADLAADLEAMHGVSARALLDELEDDIGQGKP